MLRRLVPLVMLTLGLSPCVEAQAAAASKSVPPVALAAKKGIQKHYVYDGADHPTPPPDWGLVGESWTRLGATELDPDTSGTTYNSTWNPGAAVFTYQRFVVGGYPHLIGFAHVPGGANLNALGITYCETNASGPFATITWYFCDSDGNCTTPAFNSYDFGTFGTGCIDLTQFGLTATMNNGSGELLVDVAFAHTDGSESIGSVGFGYNLQISPPPGSPTFSDVPMSDTAFPFVEALVSAGITVGCDVGPPARYCPDDTVTRRQMAVFISKALGLDWPGF